MKKKLLAVLLVMAMVISSLVACGTGTGEDATEAPEETQAPANEQEPSADETEAPADQGATLPEDTGKTLRIYCWNDEFKSRMAKFYPGYDDAASTIGDVKVEWVITPSDDGAYQKKLDKTLKQQEKATDDEKIDIFLVEADYALKYVNTDYSLDINELGVTDADIANQYKYTQEIMTSTDGKIKGLSWQATPGLFMYRRSIAKEIFGTDDPDQVQEILSDWDKFNEAAKKLYDDSNGKYAMLSGFDDAYRAFSNNVSSPWVNDDKQIVIDAQLENWVKQTKEFTDKGYNQKTSLWSDEWAKGQGSSGSVFGYFFSTWGIAFTLRDNSLDKPLDDGGKEEVGNGIWGDWAACRGPAQYYWGGTWICGATGCDNMNLVKDIMLKMTCDKDNMKKITLEESDYVNNKEAIDEIIADGYSCGLLGGQDHLSLLTEAAEQIDMSKTCPYDQGCNEAYQKAYSDYFNGKVDADKALANFYKKVETQYPELKK